MASMLKSVNPVTTKAWQELLECAAMDGALSIKELFVEDPARFEKFSRSFEDLWIDFSRSHFTDENFKSLVALAKETGLQDAIK